MAREGTAGRQRAARRRPDRRIVVITAVVLLVLGLTTAVVTTRALSVAAAAQTAVRHAALVRNDIAEKVARGATDGFQNPTPSSPPTQTKAVPTRVEIPAIKVDAHLQKLKVDSTGVLQPPTNFTDAGWYSGGVRPGNIGPAVIAGHFDAAVGPAVFDNLRLIRPGDRIDVRMSDGTTVHFTVNSAAFVRKALFPSSAVYGPTPDAELRVITCGGMFDSTWGHYLDNLVVYATRTS